jgi:hypothetical protein
LAKGGFYFHRNYSLRDGRLDKTIAGMNRILQGLLLTILTVVIPVPLLAKDDLQGKYKPPTINRRLFGDELSMINNERDEYATNLAAFAVKTVRARKGDQSSLDTARQLLGLALHLSHRNRKSIIVNRQLKDGILPHDIQADYDSEVFAKLLMARGELLENQAGDTNMLLSRYLIALAALIDPRNEDAIYEAEMRRIDGGDVSWSKMTDAKKN